MLPKLNIYSFNVSSLSHAEYCPVRSKIEVLNKNRNFTTINKAMIKGTRMHVLYSLPNKSFDRLLVKGRLRRYSRINKYGIRVFDKEIQTKEYIIRVTGIYDDIRIVKVKGKKYTVLIEVFTTSKKYVWTHEIRTKVRQLELYMWILKDLLEKIEYPLWDRGYVEIYSQNTGNLIKSIPVKYNEDIEEWIKHTVEGYMGLTSVKIPPFKYCKYCPKHIRKVCSWYKIRKGEKI